MGYNLDGTTKIVALTPGTTTLDVRDFYSRWKDWVLSTGSKFPQAISVVGGEPVNVSGGVYITSYFFLENEWKIKPQEADHKLEVLNGILLSSDGSDPFVQTSGDYNVLIQYSQPIKSETISTGGGAGVWSESEKDHIVATIDDVRAELDSPLATKFNEIKGTGFTSSSTLAKIKEVVDEIKTKPSTGAGFKL